MAIALDNTAEGLSASGATSVTVSLTVGSGSDRYLLAGVFSNGADDVTGVTYASVAMTQLHKAVVNVAAVGYLYIYGLANPSSGTNNLVASRSGSSSKIYAGGVSYTGVKQTGQPDATATTTTNGTQSSCTPTLTTIADNCWLFTVGHQDNLQTISASTGATLRGNSNGGYGIFDSNGAKTPAGSYSMTVTTQAAANFATILLTQKPQI
jgi:hypothetical protein